MSNSFIGLENIVIAPTASIFRLKHTVLPLFVRHGKESLINPEEKDQRWRE
jgi:hypothetical protein